MRRIEIYEIALVIEFVAFTLLLLYAAWYILYGLYFKLLA